MPSLRVAFLALAAAVHPLSGQATPQTFAPSHLAAAQRVVDLLQIETSLTKTAPFTSSAATQAGLPPGLMEKVQEIMLKRLKWEELKPQFARAYAEQFSEPELVELGTFYASPTGRKLTDAQPQLMNSIRVIFQKAMEPHMAEIMNVVMQGMKPPA